MKKFYKIIILLLLLMIPLNIKAAGIYASFVSGPDSIKIGTEFSETFNIRFDGIKQNDKDSLGVAAVVFELVFDDTVLTPTGINSNGWTSELDYDEKEKKYYIASTIGLHPEYVCSDGILNCGRYNITVEFLVNDTKKGTTSIKIGEIQVGFHKQILDESITFDEKNLVIAKGKGENTHTITIKDNEKVSTVVEKPSIVKNTDKVDISKNVKNNTKTPTSKTPQDTTTSTDKKNNHLKSLQIENYDITFDKYKNIYSIEVPSDVNELKVTAVAEGAKAKVEITGADNLENNKNRVNIVVTPEEGDTKTYIINVTKIEDKKVAKKKGFSLTEDQIEIGKYALIGLAGFIILIVIIIKIRDKIVEKGIDKL